MLQAVRCAIQEIITTGQRYSGVFGQVKMVHEFVLNNTNFTKKQIRWELLEFNVMRDCYREVLSELQPKINKYFTGSSEKISGKTSKMFAPPPATSLPWNYGFSGCKAKGLSTPRHTPSKVVCQDMEARTQSLSMMDIHQLERLARRSNLINVSNMYLDM